MYTIFYIIHSLHRGSATATLFDDWAACAVAGETIFLVVAGGYMFFSDVTKLNLNSAGEFNFNFELAGKNKLWAVMHFVVLVDGSCLVLFWHLMVVTSG